MGLKLTIKPGERFFVGASEVLVAAEHIITVIVSGDEPVLREEDYVEPQSVSSLTDELRLIVQRMYLSGSITAWHSDYLRLFQEIWQAEPAQRAALTAVSAQLMDGKAYRAVKAAKTLSETPTLRLVAI